MKATLKVYWMASYDPTFDCVTLQAAYLKGDEVRGGCRAVSVTGFMQTRTDALEAIIRDEAAKAAGLEDAEDITQWTQSSVEEALAEGRRMLESALRTASADRDIQKTS